VPEFAKAKRLQNLLAEARKRDWKVRKVHPINWRHSVARNCVFLTEA
jgi:hypothetical protein